MKKLLGIFAVGILAMALLTACGNGANEVEKTTFAGSLDYEIGTDSGFSEFIIDTSRVTKDTIEQVWGNGVFVYNSDGTMSYSKTAENLQDNGYEKQ